MSQEFERLGTFEPGDATDPSGDEATLRRLAEADADMSRPTEFIHYLSFVAEEDMLTAAREMRQKLGYDMEGYGPSDSQDGWSLWVKMVRLPTSEEVKKMRKIMTIAADRFSGTYEGWEAEVRR